MTTSFGGLASFVDLLRGLVIHGCKLLAFPSFLWSFRRTEKNTLDLGKQHLVLGWWQVQVLLVYSTHTLDISRPSFALHYLSFLLESSAGFTFQKRSHKTIQQMKMKEVLLKISHNKALTELTTGCFWRTVALSLDWLPAPIAAFYSSSTQASSWLFWRMRKRCPSSIMALLYPMEHWHTCWALFSQVTLVTSCPRDYLFSPPSSLWPLACSWWVPPQFWVYQIKSGSSWSV